MRIEKKMTYYGYDLMINHVWHKKCLNCEKWYEFDGEMGFCIGCIFITEKEKANGIHEIHSKLNQ
jgi:hypothetical protein